MSEDETEHRNEIILVGRVTSPATERKLPSGDVIHQWRVTVDRPGAEGGRDVVDCTAWTARLQRSAASWRKGDVVEVQGSLRRRFWRGHGGTLGSSCEVEVRRARRLAAAPPRPRKPE